MDNSMDYITQRRRSRQLIVKSAWSNQLPGRHPSTLGNTYPSGNTYASSNALESCSGSDVTIISNPERCPIRTSLRPVYPGEARPTFLQLSWHKMRKCLCPFFSPSPWPLSYATAPTIAYRACPIIKCCMEHSESNPAWMPWLRTHRGRNSTASSSKQPNSGPEE